MTNQKLEKVFRDPIHGYIHVDHSIIYQLINAAEFQRLRRIKQLGTASFTFHGAEHSRFSHCLGAYHIARVITDYFTETYPSDWDPAENLVTQCAALLHDIGHGAYSHTFEGLFDTFHEDITVQIITNPETEINAILKQVDPNFPSQVASVITHFYPNPQVVQLISSQIDVDRMDYLLRDAYYTGAVYGQFDMTRILRFITPIKDGIAFKIQGMHAVEDYIISRYQMYMQVYFHKANRAMEVLLYALLDRAKALYSDQSAYFKQVSPRLIPFFEKNYDLTDYLKLDDGVLNTYFQDWMDHPDPILSDLATAYINRKIFKSVKFDKSHEGHLELLRDLVEKKGLDPAYYTAVNASFDLPYDFYRPAANKPRTNIEILEKDGTTTELSKLSSIVAALAGTSHGNQRFYFPKEMLSLPEFTSYIRNDELI